MAVKLSPVFQGPILDSSGNPYVGAQLFTYVSGSTTKQTAYQDSAGLTPHTNPIVLNSRGEPPAPIWLTTGVNYKLYLTTPTDSDPPVTSVRVIDVVTGVNDTTSAIDQWVAGPTPTFISTTSFSLAGDQTTIFHVGRRVKTTNSGGTIYSRISASAFTTLTTITVVNDSGVLDSGLSAVSYALLSATNPSVPVIASIGSGLVVLVDAGRDRLRLQPEPSGSGFSVDAVNAGVTDYEQLNLRGEYVALFYRTGVNAIAEGARLEAGAFMVGDTSNANNTKGLTLNQGAADDEILSLKSSDVAHGMTGATETDTYLLIKKRIAANGGAILSGFSAGTKGIEISGAHVTDDATKSTSANGAIGLTALLRSGSGTGVNGANTNLVVVATDTTTRFILDADGDSHQDVGTAWTNFDDHEDVALLTALSVHVSRDGDPIKQNFGEFLGFNRKRLEELRLVTFNEDGHHFVNMSKLTMLLTGAVRQISEKAASMEQRLSRMEKLLLPAG
jgi:hypothetical protein